MLAAYVGVAHAVGVSSGTDALLLAIIALRHPAGRRGRCRRTRSSPRRAASRLGATPVLVDIDPITCQHRSRRHRGRRHVADARDRPRPPVRAERGPRPAAGRRAARAGVPVIEDAAQAIGATYKGQIVVASAGGCFSLLQQNLSPLEQQARHHE